MALPRSFKLVAGSFYDAGFRYERSFSLDDIGLDVSDYRDVEDLINDIYENVDLDDFRQEAVDVWVDVDYEAEGER